MAVFQVGDRVFVEYDSGGGVGYGTYHERYVLGHLHGAHYAIATPDFDVYIEELADTNPDLTSIRVGRNGNLPVGVRAADVYGFVNFPPGSEADLKEEGRLLIAQERMAAGLGAGAVGGLPVGAAAIPIAPVLPIAGPPAPGAVAVGGVPSPNRIVPAGGAWILDEPLGKHGSVGDVFALPAGAVQLGSRALVSIGGEEAVLRRLDPGVDIDVYVAARLELLRTDPRLGSAQGLSNRSPAQSIAELEECPLADLDRVISGPRTAPTWYRTAMRDQAASFIMRHEKWKTSCGARQGLPLMFEHEMLSHVVDIAVNADGLNIFNLRSFELVCRRMQLHEHAVHENPEAPSYEGARHWMGVQERRGGALIVPSLEQYVAKETGQEAAILKEKRKAREAKEAMRKSKGQNQANKG